MQIRCMHARTYQVYAHTSNTDQVHTPRIQARSIYTHTHLEYRYICTYLNDGRFRMTRANRVHMRRPKSSHELSTVDQSLAQ